MTAMESSLFTDLGTNWLLTASGPTRRAASSRKRMTTIEHGA